MSKARFGPDVIEAARRIVDQADRPRKRPTVTELEAILNCPDEPPIHINPDGSIGAGPSDALTVARALLDAVEGDKGNTRLSGRDGPSDEYRNAVLKEAWQKIDDMIIRGPLPGNGTDRSAQRNGLILATNVILAMTQPEGASNPSPKGKEDAQ